MAPGCFAGSLLDGFMVDAEHLIDRAAAADVGQQAHELLTAAERPAVCGVTPAVTSSSTRPTRPGSAATGPTTAGSTRGPRGRPRGRCLLARRDPKITRYVRPSVAHELASRASRAGDRRLDPRGSRGPAAAAAGGAAVSRPLAIVDGAADHDGLGRRPRRDRQATSRPTSSARPTRAALALWLVYTHLIPTKGPPPYDVVPYVFITSVERQSGKTTLLDVMRPIAARPVMLAGDQPGGAAADARRPPDPVPRRGRHDLPSVSRRRHPGDAARDPELGLPGDGEVRPVRASSTRSTRHSARRRSRASAATSPSRSMTGASSSGSSGGAPTASERSSGRASAGWTRRARRSPSGSRRRSRASPSRRSVTTTFLTSSPTERPTSGSLSWPSPTRLARSGRDGAEGRRRPSAAAPPTTSCPSASSSSATSASSSRRPSRRPTSSRPRTSSATRPTPRQQVRGEGPVRDRGRARGPSYGRTNRPITPHRFWKLIGGYRIPKVNNGQARGMRPWAFAERVRSLLAEGQRRTGTKATDTSTLTRTPSQPRLGQPLISISSLSHEDLGQVRQPDTRRGVWSKCQCSGAGLCRRLWTAAKRRLGRGPPQLLPGLRRLLEEVFADAGQVWGPGRPEPTGAAGRAAGSGGRGAVDARVPPGRRELASFRHGQEIVCSCIASWRPGSAATRRPTSRGRRSSGRSTTSCSRTAC